MSYRVAVVGAFNIDSRKAHAINVCNIAKGFEKLRNRKLFCSFGKENWFFLIGSIDCSNGCLPNIQFRRLGRFPSRKKSQFWVY